MHVALVVPLLISPRVFTNSAYSCAIENQDLFNLFYLYSACMNSVDIQLTEIQLLSFSYMSEMTAFTSIHVLPLKLHPSQLRASALQMSWAARL